LRRPVLLKGALSRQAEHDIVVRAAEGGRSGDRLRLVRREPAPSGSNILLAWRAAGYPEKLGEIDRPAKLIHLGCGARIILLDAGPERLTGLIQQNHRRHHAAHAD